MSVAGVCKELAVRGGLKSSAFSRLRVPRLAQLCLWRRFRDGAHHADDMPKCAVR
jgi:hypothetical protein